MTPGERIHELGAQRHNARWLLANRRAIEAASAAGLNYSGEKEKMAIAAIVLMVLDGEKVDAGFVWSHEAKKWLPRSAVAIAKRLLGGAA